MVAVLHPLPKKNSFPLTHESCLINARKGQRGSLKESKSRHPSELNWISPLTANTGRGTDLPPGDDRAGGTPKLATWVLGAEKVRTEYRERRRKQREVEGSRAKRRNEDDNAEPKADSSLDIQVSPASFPMENSLIARRLGWRKLRGFQPVRVLSLSKFTSDTRTFQSGGGKIQGRFAESLPKIQE